MRITMKCAREGCVEEKKVEVAFEGNTLIESQATMERFQQQMDSGTWTNDAKGNPFCSSACLKQVTA